MNLDEILAQADEEIESRVQMELEEFEMLPCDEIHREELVNRIRRTIRAEVYKDIIEELIDTMQIKKAFEDKPFKFPSGRGF